MTLWTVGLVIVARAGPPVYGPTPSGPKQPRSQPPLSIVISLRIINKRRGPTAGGSVGPPGAAWWWPGAVQTRKCSLGRSAPVVGIRRAAVLVDGGTRVEMIKSVKSELYVQYAGERWELVY
eukprot:8532260-Pyramimonas_sp.AAC.1